MGFTMTAPELIDNLLRLEAVLNNEHAIEYVPEEIKALNLLF